MSIEEVLLTAMDIEKEGEMFYSKASMEVRDPVARNTLRFLSEEEKRHLKFIESVYNTLKKGEDVEGIKKEFHNVKVFPDYPEFISGVKASEKDFKILMEAKEIEKRSKEFYQNKMSEVEGEREREIIEMLAKEEEKHYRWIEYLESYVEEHGYWTGIDKYFSLNGA